MCERVSVHEILTFQFSKENYVSFSEFATGHLFRGFKNMSTNCLIFFLSGGGLSAPLEYGLVLATCFQRIECSRSKRV